MRTAIATTSTSRPPRRIRILGLAALALLVLATTACLGPDEPDPTGRAPFGSLDLVAANGDGIRVAGWVIDRDGGPVLVEMAHNHVTWRTYANIPRPDVAAAVPGYGADKGFDFTIPNQGPGEHEVCVIVKTVGPGDDRLLGCKKTTLGDNSPFGNLEAVSQDGPARVRVSGWAIDPSVGDPVAVGIFMDSQVVTNVPANIWRQDVANAFGLGGSRGFSVDFPAAPGTHNVCVIMANVGRGDHRWLGCNAINVSAQGLPDRRPSGGVTSIAPVAGGVRVVGSATDPDGSPVNVAVAVDGVVRANVASTGSFNTTIGGLTAGSHKVCVTAVDVPYTGGGFVTTGDRAFPCGTVVINSGSGTISVGGGGAPVGPPTPVAPPAGHALDGVDRDGGISTTLSDGSTLWLFGDSSETVNNQLQYFVNNTAAWAAPGQPTVTLDGVVSGNRPQTFVTPTSQFNCPAGWSSVMWPQSATTRPLPNGQDQVLAFFGNVCAGPNFGDFYGVGVALVTWDYNPVDPPNGRPITGTVRNQYLFANDDPYGTAAMIAQDGNLYAYQCDAPPNGGFPVAFGPCTVGRVAPANAENRNAWTFWNGSAWVANEATAAPMTMPGDPNGDPQVPVASMTITRDPVAGAYVMAYSPWPGYTNEIFIRVATSPQGPWTAPVRVELPGCSDSIGGTGYYCYAGTAQPELSTPGYIGLGYYDQLVSVGPNRGQYLVVRVPFTVVHN